MSSGCDVPGGKVAGISHQPPVTCLLQDEQGFQDEIQLFPVPQPSTLNHQPLRKLPKNSGEHLFEVIMRRYENRSTIMTSNRPLEEWGKLLGDVPTAGAILDRFLHHAQTIAITGRSYRLKDHATIAGKEDKNKKTKSKPNEPSTAEPAS